jgi:hypothetical protein
MKSCKAWTVAFRGFPSSILEPSFLLAYIYPERSGNYSASTDDLIFIYRFPRNEATGSYASQPIEFIDVEL